MAWKRTDGTADIEQKKFYRTNGTTDIQIGKMYRNYGATDVLIYQSFDGILWDGTIIGGDGGSWVRRSSYGEFYTTTNTTDRLPAIYQALWCVDGDVHKNLVSTTQPIPISGFTTCTITYRNAGYSNNGGINPTCIFGFSTFDNTSMPIQEGIDGSIELSNFAAYGGQNWGVTNAYRTETFDVSGLNGDYYFHWFMRQYGGNASAQTWLYTVTLS